MTDFVFPDINAHFVTINGYNLVFSSGRSSVLNTSAVGFDFIRNCSGLTLAESEQMLRERYGEASAEVAYNLKRVVESRYFAEPHLDYTKCDAELPSLISFGIGITHKCNMRCQYCFAAGLRGTDLPEDISFDKARSAVDFLFDRLFDDLRPPWVTISLGITGEPQLRWDIIRDVIEHAHIRSEDSLTGVDFHITTNGLLTCQDMLDYLRTHDDLNVTLSWDGPSEIHNPLRLDADGIGTYERVSNTFDILQSTMQSRLSVVASVSALNPNIADIFTHMFDKGVRDLIIKPIRSADPALGITKESLYAFKSGYAELAELLLRSDSAQIERLFTIMKEDDPLGRLVMALTKRRRMTFRCMAARTHFDVDTNGDIYPCPSVVGIADFRMGNISSGLDEGAIESYRKETFCENLNACKNCWAKYYCGGPCTYVSFITSERFTIPHQPSCELTKYLVELAGYIVSRLDSERPGLLAHVVALRSPVPMGHRPETSCSRAPKSDLWALPIKAWEARNPFVLASKEHIGGCKRWLGPVDCSATIHLKWNEKFLYLMVEVCDDKFVPPSSSEDEWWCKDSIQFALDPESDGGENLYPWKLPKGDYEYGVAWVDGQARLYDCQVDPIRPSRSGKATVVREGDTTIYRVAIPWKQIFGFTPSVGAECRFNVVINDCDGDTRGWLQWTNGLATKKAPARFGLLRLVE